MENILHITSRAEWEQARRQGEYTAPSLARQGFIHGSFKSQVIDVANYNFEGQKGLVLLEIDPKRLKAQVKLEDLLNEGELFPHIYGPLSLDAVIAVHDFEWDPAGSFSLPTALR